MIVRSIIEGYLAEARRRFTRSAAPEAAAGPVPTSPAPRRPTRRARGERRSAPLEAAQVDGRTRAAEVERIRALAAMLGFGEIAVCHDHRAASRVPGRRAT